MGMSYQAKDEAVQSVQLKVQELVVKLSDNQVISASASDVTIDVQESIAEVRCALHMDDSAGTIAPVVAANQLISGTSVKLTLSAAMAAADCIVLKYVVSE